MAYIDVVTREQNICFDVSPVYFREKTPKEKCATTINSHGNAKHSGNKQRRIKPA